MLPDLERAERIGEF